ncbi:DoxX family protein [Myxococcota bacterium]|jgi:putative oxidoreductase|nr:DoxX family protein [Myxococcota bacterium]
MNFLQDKKAEIYALGRIVFGFLFMLHGIGKLTAGGAPDYMWAWAFWVAGLLETIGGALIVVGLFGQIAAFLCSGLMAVAFFSMHFNLGGGIEGWNPLTNKGELAVLYCFGFLVMAANGTGTWSVDSKRE